ncbi:MBL fold metallo-hydrolase [Actinoplanes solisilvae]|uniref:MBL fold metallo-hydrolase n=1 Tax=Actinoplanes solisilvae TaxID=2486853 RepID=UPI000FDA04CB|nr:MBL fold metallo-hydrolase [Actinoplanes solisilvae]
MEYDVKYIRRPGLTRDLPHAPEDLLWVTNTATLVHGERDAVLIDTFPTVEQNAELIEWVADFGRRLTHVYITHGHPDHFLGLGQLQKAFPGVRVVATKATVEHAATQNIERWRSLFPGGITEQVVLPDVLDDDVIEVEGEQLKIIETGFTDTTGSTAIWAPLQRLLVAGDGVYNDTHVFQGETTAERRRGWIATVERLHRLKPAAVVAGHKNPDRPDDPAILDETATYLRDFEALATATSSAEELYDAMLQRHPRRLNPGSLWGAAQRFG